MIPDVRHADRLVPFIHLIDILPVEQLLDLRAQFEVRRVLAGSAFISTLVDIPHLTLKRPVQI